MCKIKKGWKIPIMRDLETYEEREAEISLKEPKYRSEDNLEILICRLEDEFNEFMLCTTKTIPKYNGSLG